MGYNHSLEEKRFEKEWLNDAEGFRKAGMTEEQISELYKFDREVFNSDRRYKERTVSLYDNPDVRNLKIYDDYLRDNRYEWSEKIADSEKYEKVMSLPEIWREAFTMYISGYTQTEISSKLMKSQQTISYWIVKIAEILL